MKRTSLLLVSTLIAACSSSNSPTDRLQGNASWYGEEMAGRTTANGEIFDPLELTAAHRTLPFGTLVRVTNERNGRQVTVRINDRGPFIESRIIDLSFAAATEIGMIEAGVVPVTVEIISRGGPNEPPRPYVIRVEPPGELIEIPKIPDDPPQIAFPLPDTAGDRDVPQRPRADAVTAEDLEVIEEREGTEMTRVVSEDGSEIVTIPAPEPEAEPIEIEPPPPAELRDSGEATEDRAESEDLWWVVQIGAFRNEENARRLMERAAELGERMMIVEIGGTLRVQAGPFIEREEAVEARDRLVRAGFDTIILER